MSTATYLTSFKMFNAPAFYKNKKGVGQKSNLIKRFRRPTPAKMTSIEKRLI